MQSQRELVPQRYPLFISLAFRVIAILITIIANLCLDRHCVFADPAHSPSRPNVVVIMADDLGYGDLGCYGATEVSTPNCDRLAREGRKFTDAHTPSAVCSPTRFGLLTGTYPWRENRVPRHLHADEPLVIRDGEATVASLLKQAGYATACVGKWHLGAQRQNPIDWQQPLRPGPNDVGFDSFFGVINSHNQAPYVWVENDTILDRRPGEVFAIEKQTVQTSGKKYRNSYEGEARLAPRAVKFLEHNQHKPFFLYYPTSAVHLPHTPGKAWQGKSKLGQYGDYIQEFDWEVGQVLDTLDRLKLADNTIVVVTADNGGIAKFGNPRHKVNGPLRAGKTTAYEGGHRVAYLVRWPGRVPAGTTCDETICHVDLMATLCAALQIELPSQAGPDSHNVLPAWLGQPHSEPLREATVCVSQMAADFSIRQGPWKLILLGGAKPGKELYNLEQDPAESKDLSAAEPQRVAELEKLLATCKKNGWSRPR